VDDPSFASAWKLFHPDVNPLGWMMRESAPDTWVRFHSLPGSKRYPETDAEWRTVLERANSLATECLGIGQTCWLVQCRLTHPDEPDAPSVADQSVPDFDLTPSFKFVDREDEEESAWIAYAHHIHWWPGHFDPLLTTKHGRFGCRTKQALSSRRMTAALICSYETGVP
jgi:hypothetical protein